MSEDLLFNKHRIFGVLQGQTEAVKKRVQTIPANTLLNASERDLVQALVEEFRLNVPVMKEDDMYISSAGETQVDVSRDPMRRFFHDHHSGGAFYVPGNKTVIAVPFEGDAEFFKIQPQSYTLNPPGTHKHRTTLSKFPCRRWMSRACCTRPTACVLSPLFESIRARSNFPLASSELSRVGLALLSISSAFEICASAS